MHHDHAEDARGLFRTLETGDSELAHRVASPRFSNREAVSGPPACALQGPAGLLASSAWLRSAFPELHLEIVDVDSVGARTWVRLRMQGRQSGTFVTFQDGRAARILPPTGRRIDVEQIHVLDMDDDGVARHEAVRDDVTMLGQLGVLPPTPGLLLATLAGRLTGRSRRAVGNVVTAAERAAATAAPAPSGR